MLVVGGHPGLAHAEEHQQAVAGIHDGMDALRDHRRRAGEGSGDELDDPDQQVADDSRDDGRRGLALRSAL